MKNFSIKKVMSVFLCVVLIAAFALTGCGKTEEPASSALPAESQVSATAESAAAESATSAADESASDVTVLGEGAVAFNFTASDLDGKETKYEIHTDKATVGEALVENELVKGTVGEWGLMVDSVNGLTLDFDKDGKYWAFFIDGEYAQTGVDSTEIIPGATYSFVPTEG